MDYQRKTLLAGIAVLALAAGTGLSPAQETLKNQGSLSKPQHATQQMNKAPAGKTGQSAQHQNRRTTGRDEIRAGKSAKDGDRNAQGTSARISATPKIVTGSKDRTRRRASATAPQPNNRIKAETMPPRTASTAACKDCRGMPRA
jgi:hypothetical protein